MSFAPPVKTKTASPASLIERSAVGKEFAESCPASTIEPKLLLVDPSAQSARKFGLTPRSHPTIASPALFTASRGPLAIELLVESVSPAGPTVKLLAFAARRACLSDEPLSVEVHTSTAFPAPSAPICGSKALAVSINCGVSGVPPAGHFTTASCVGDAAHVAK